MTPSPCDRQPVGRRRFSPALASRGRRTASERRAALIAIAPSDVRAAPRMNLS
jgi:hypothetical protein